ELIIFGLPTAPAAAPRRPRARPALARALVATEGCIQARARESMAPRTAPNRHATWSSGATAAPPGACGPVDLVRGAGLPVRPRRGLLITVEVLGDLVDDVFGLGARQWNFAFEGLGLRQPLSHGQSIADFADQLLHATQLTVVDVAVAGR